MSTDARQYPVAIVDDDSGVREAISELLASAGFSSRIYGSATEILDAGQLKVSSCLITDIHMPGMDGLAFQSEAVAHFPQLPGIFITAYQDERSRKLVVEQSAFALLYKPFDGEELLEIVDSAVRLNVDIGPRANIEERMVPQCFEA